MATTWSTKYKVIAVYKDRQVDGLFDSEQDAIDYVTAFHADPNTTYDDESETRIYYIPVQVGAISV